MLGTACARVTRLRGVVTCPTSMSLRGRRRGSRLRRQRVFRGAGVATLRRVLFIAGSILLAVFVVPESWGAVLVGCAIVWEIAEKVFWVRYTKRIPVAVGREAMIGRPVTVVSTCQPDGRVQLFGERWKARCHAGASVGDRLVIEAVDQITLVVGRPNPTSAYGLPIARRTHTARPRHRRRVSRLAADRRLRDLEHCAVTVPSVAER